MFFWESILLLDMFFPQGCIRMKELPGIIVYSPGRFLFFVLTMWETISLLDICFSHFFPGGLKQLEGWMNWAIHVLYSTLEHVAHCLGSTRLVSLYPEKSDNHCGGSGNRASHTPGYLELSRGSTWPKRASSPSKIAASCGVAETQTDF